MSNPRTESGTQSESGRQSERGSATGGRTTEGGAKLNARVANVSKGLSNAVTGREDLIRVNAARAASKLDAKTEGRHHEKLRVALHVLDFVIDRFGQPAPDSKRSAHHFDPERAAASSGGSPRSDRSGAGSSRAGRAHDDAEDLGEFRVKGE